MFISCLFNEVIILPKRDNKTHDKNKGHVLFRLSGSLFVIEDKKTRVVALRRVGQISKSSIYFFSAYIGSLVSIYKHKK